MLASDIPVKFQVPFANSAGVGFITEPVPLTTAAPGRASLQAGFPPTTFDPVSSGGNPPWGADMNGILFQTTAWLRWAQAGGIPLVYDAAFSSSVGGYPQGASLRAATIGNGRYWISSVDNNTSNPDAAGANWIAFPDLNVQLQRPNYAVDAGTTNAYSITLFPASTFASLVGSPVRFKAGSSNSITTPTIVINGSVAATMVNADGSALAIGQIVTGGIVEGIPRDDGKFQVNSPIKGATATSNFVTGCIYIWPNETAPSGTLEVAGQTLAIATYPGLYAIIGTRYGGDGVTTFKLPDLRGEFVRGWDHGRGLDPNAGARTNAGGGLTGDHVGTNQTGAAGPISFSGGAVQIDNPLFSNSSGGVGPAALQYTAGGATQLGLGSDGSGTAPVNRITGTISLSGSSGAETRPVNIYMMYIIAV